MYKMKPCLLLRFLLACFLILPATAVPAQPAPTELCWITFRQKNPALPPAISPQTVAQRQAQHLPIDDSDRPIDPAYIAQLQAFGVQMRCRSRWFNAVSAALTPAQRLALGRWPMVQSVEPLEPGLVVCSTGNAAEPDHDPRVAPVIRQIQGDLFAKAGLTGRFVAIGVIDAGFFGANVMEALTHVAERDGFRAIHDYVAPARTQNRLFQTFDTRSDLHGTRVLAAVAGLNLKRGEQFGLATDAQFYLARTDQGNREYRGEEDNWIQALEWMDSLGVRLVNTSLGYARGMTDPRDNYTPEQMDGHTSRISRAAQIGAYQKGMLIIVSAGNEGEVANWRIISTPADAPGVMAVGATGDRHWGRANYSSIGPDFLTYLKPNVAVFSQFGTSLAAPVVTGFAACLMQADPSLSNAQLRAIIEQSGHLYPFGNTFVGYGVPQAARALALLRHETPAITTRSQTATADTATLDLTDPAASVLIFRKRDPIHVIRQETAETKNNRLFISRLPGETHTTVDAKTEVIEVIWP
jgi:subtilisin